MRSVLLSSIRFRWKKGGSAHFPKKICVILRLIKIAEGVYTFCFENP